MISVRPSKFCSKALLPTILLFVDAVLILVAWPLSDAGAEPRRYWAHPDIFLLLPGLCFLFATHGHYTNRGSFSTEAAQVVLLVFNADKASRWGADQGCRACN